MVWAWSLSVPMLRRVGSKFPKLAECEPSLLGPTNPRLLVFPCPYWSVEKSLPHDPIADWRRGKSPEDDPLFL